MNNGASIAAIPTLRCKSCGATVYLEDDWSECECGCMWVRRWAFDSNDATIEYWEFISVSGRRRKNERD